MSDCLRSESQDGAVASGAPLVRIEGITKRFGANTVLDGIDLTIDEGEFFTLLGPSGSGKTTLLRLISGFEHPDSGRILLRGADVAQLPPHLREVNTVFQDYALFPHMNVLENIAFGPLTRKVSKAEAFEKARAALDVVRLGELGERRPGQLSGGQRQRVAIARAIVNQPCVLLLDEPLGALDLKLRHQLQGELKRIQQELGIAFVYVTHDQEEALALSDRIAVFEEGRIAQTGTPHELYERPANRFVADFVGISNLVVREGQTVMIRPERIALGLENGCGEHTASEPGTVSEATYLGPITRCTLHLDSGEDLAVVLLNSGAPDAPDPRPGDRLWASWNRSDMIPVRK